jgi:viroplasmin and RNaseH domain-containing protein
LGHEFLNPVYTVNYEIDNQKFQVFILDAKTVENAKNILTAYFQFTKQTKPFAEGKLLINDRYNGNIPAIWKGRYIVGAFNEQGTDFPEEIYRFF